MLGSGDYAVVIGDWQAGRMYWQSPEGALIEVDWSRELNEMSKASARITAPDSVINGIEPWAHTMGIYRNGSLVWFGIIVQTTAKAGVVEIEAADGAKFFKHRRVPLHRLWQQHDATQVMRTHVEDACGYLDACSMVENLVTHESRIWVNASYTPSECMVDDVIDDLVEQGLVWTINAGTLIIGPLPGQYTTAQLSDKDLSGEFTVIKDGSDVVTDCHVKGKGVWGQFREDSPLGLVQSIEKADGAVREEECQQQAERRVKESAVTPRRLVIPNDSQLLPTAPLSIGELVPGVKVPIASTVTGINVASIMAVKSVKVNVSDKGEQVKVTLTETKVTNEVTSMPDPAKIDMRSPWEKELASKNHSGAGSGEKQDTEQVGRPPA